MVDECFADLLVESGVLEELKTVSDIVGAQEAQLLNYLKAANIVTGLLLNCGKKPDHERNLFTNLKKPLLSALFEQ